MQRWGLGVAGVVLIFAGAFVLLYYGWEAGAASSLASIFLRAGLVVFAAWLAYPQIRQVVHKVPWWILAWGGAALLLLVVWPKLFPVLFMLVAAAAVLQFLGWIMKPLAARPRENTQSPTTTTQEPAAPEHSTSSSKHP